MCHTLKFLNPFEYCKKTFFAPLLSNHNIVIHETLIVYMLILCNFYYCSGFGYLHEILWECALGKVVVSRARMIVLPFSDSKLMQ